MDEKKKKLLEFIKKQTLAVISTTNAENNSESAVLEFGETDGLELIFDTYNTSRKYKNLQRNKNVSFVIGWDENITIQYEGTAEEIKGESAKKYKEAYWSKNPQAKRWESREGISYFKVTPKWIRYSNLTQDPWDIFEVNFSYER